MLYDSEARTYVSTARGHGVDTGPNDEGPSPKERASDLDFFGALGGTRTPNLLIRR